MSRAQDYQDYNEMLHSSHDKQNNISFCSNPLAHLTMLPPKHSSCKNSTEIVDKFI